MRAPCFQHCHYKSCELQQGHSSSVWKWKWTKVMALLWSSSLKFVSCWASTAQYCNTTGRFELRSCVQQTPTSAELAEVHPTPLPHLLQPLRRSDCAQSFTTQRSFAVHCPCIASHPHCFSTHGLVLPIMDTVCLEQTFWEFVSLRNLTPPPKKSTEDEQHKASDPFVLGMIVCTSLRYIFCTFARLHATYENEGLALYMVRPLSLA